MAKFCGNCGKEVDPKAVICVSCGSAIKSNSNSNTNNTNNQNEKKGLPWWAILLIVLGGLGVLGILIFVFIMIGVFSFTSIADTGYDEFRDAYNDILDDTMDEIEERQKSNETLRGTVRDTLNTDNYSMTLLEYKTMDVIEDTYSNKEASDGKEFLVLFFRVNNVSDKSLYISNYDFDGYVDGKKTDYTYFYHDINGYSELSGSIARGKYIEGHIVYEVSKEWKDFEIQFTDDEDYLNKTDVIFKIVKDNENKDN